MGGRTRTVGGESNTYCVNRSGHWNFGVFDAVMVPRRFGVVLNCWCGVGRVGTYQTTVLDVNSLESCPRIPP